MIRSLVAKILPRSFVEFIKLCRLRGARRQVELSLRFRTLRRRNREALKLIAPGRFEFPGTPGFMVHSEAVEAFEYFTFREADATAEMDEFIEETRDRKCLLDIGAHYGAFSIAFCAGREAVALAIEPSPKALTLLRWHAEKNPDLQIKVYPLALSYQTGSIQMRYAWTHLVHSSAEAAADETEITVPTMPVDSFLPQEGFNPDCLKLDVEGDEWNVLRGAERYLREHGPLLFLEVHPVLLEPQGCSVGQICNFLTEMGYSIYGNRRRLHGDPEKYTRGAVTRLVCRKESPSLA